MLNLTNKTALITGATGGIGEAIARTLHAQGATVTISGTRVEKLDALKAELNERVFAFGCNLKEADSIKNLVKQTEEAMGGIDILVNNAGITKDGLSMRMSDADFMEVLEVNLLSTFRLSQGVMRGMMKKRTGRIINISSIVGTMGNPGQANYVASKAGLNGMTKTLAAELASRGITVNSIAPGFIRTPMTDALTEEQQNKMKAVIPSGAFGEPADVANAVAFLASDESRYITGQTLHVNGGMLMV